MAGLGLLAMLGGCALAPPLPAAPAPVQLGDVAFWPQTRYQCGPAALASVLNHSGVAVTPAELESQVYLPDRRGSLQAELLATPRDYGRIGYRLPGTPQALQASLLAGHPVLVLLNQGWRRFPLWHYAVVTGIDQRQVVLHSGRQRKLRMHWRRFARQWQRADFWAVTVRKPGEPPFELEPAALLRQLAPIEQPYPRLALQAYAAALQRWPQHPGLLFANATTHLRLEQPAAAQRGFDKLLRQQPGDIAASNNLALALYARGHIDQAYSLVATLLGQLAEDSPWQPVVLETLQQIEAAF